jgi:hypothetical protein
MAGVNQSMVLKLSLKSHRISGVLIAPLLQFPIVLRKRHINRHISHVLSRSLGRLIISGLYQHEKRRLNRMLSLLIWILDHLDNPNT